MWIFMGSMDHTHEVWKIVKALRMHTAGRRKYILFTKCGQDNSKIFEQKSGKYLAHNYGTRVADDTVI